MSPEYLAEYISSVKAELAISISTPGPADPAILARLPEVLHPLYVLADGLDFPFMGFSDAIIVAAELGHEVPDDVLDPAWAWFGHDGWAVRYLCRRVPTGGLDFALWEPEVRIPVEPGFRSIPKLMEHELQRFRASAERRERQMFFWSFPRRAKA